MPDWQVIAVWIVLAGPLVALLFALGELHQVRQYLRIPVRCQKHT